MKRDQNRRDAPREPSRGAASAEVVVPVKPLEPRRALFVGLFLFFLVWVGVLLAMWFFTVHRKG